VALNLFVVERGLSTRLNAGLVVLRVATGIVLMAHGWQKVFTMGIGGVTQGFTQMGIPLPGVTAPLVSFVELLGGLALIFGLLTRLAAFGLAINMLGAMILVHLSAGFFLPNGYEFVLTLMANCIAIMLMGPGEYSIDAGISGRRPVVAAAAY
jgi:putative oxidoreductase